jgi:tRNA A37 threonylcarbamoyladenosine biosynthesis protein TsaE
MLNWLKYKLVVWLTSPAYSAISELLQESITHYKIYQLDTSKELIDIYVTQLVGINKARDYYKKGNNNGSQS